MLTSTIPAARRLWLGALLLLAGALLSPATGHAQSFPKLTGRVVDNADLLPPADEAALTTKLEELEKQSGRQLVVATIPDLQGYEIEEYGYQLGRTWGIGDKERNDGALLIVAPNERKVRIEVGYGLEGILTDALSSIIIQQDILPRFRNGDFAGGIAAGADSIIVQLALPEDDARAYAEQAEQQARKSKSDAPPGIVIIWIIIILFFIVIPIIRASRRGGKRHRRSSGLGPIVIWGPGSGGGWGGGSGGSSWGGGGFGGGGGSFGGGGASGGW